MDNKKLEKLNIMRNYLKKCNSVYDCHVYGNIPIKKIDNARASYARGVRNEEVIGLIDETILGTGKKGILFTYEGYYHNGNNGLIRYDEGYNFT